MTSFLRWMALGIRIYIMKIEIVEPKGDAFCRMCFVSSLQKPKTLRGLRSLKVTSTSANGRAVSFYCMDHARDLREMFNGVVI